MKNGKRRKPRAAGRTSQTPERSAEIARLKKMADREIDLSDIPEVADGRKAVMGKFYRPTNNRRA